MSCDIIQNRLLALADPAAVPADLRAHIDGCDRCRRYRARLAVLNTELAALSAPPSDGAKAAFLDALTAAGPVIRSVPSVPVHSGWSLQTLVARAGWRPLAGLAAAVAVGAGIVWWEGRSPRPPEKDFAAGPRHELLRKAVEFNTRLAKANTPQERIPVLAEMAVALKAETDGVYKAAQTQDDVRSLTAMFESVVADGIVKQAGRLDKFVPAAERHQVLSAAADQLAAAATDADNMTRTAPPQVKDSLAQMAKAARDGRQQLIRLREGKG